MGTGFNYIQTLYLLPTSKNSILPTRSLCQHPLPYFIVIFQEPLLLYYALSIFMPFFAFTMLMIEPNMSSLLFLLWMTASQIAYHNSFIATRESGRQRLANHPFNMIVCSLSYCFRLPHCNCQLHCSITRCYHLFGENTTKIVLVLSSSQTLENFPLDLTIYCFYYILYTVHGILVCPQPLH